MPKSVQHLTYLRMLQMMADQSRQELAALMRRSSGRTSMLELPVNVLLPTHPECGERRHHQLCRRSHERQLGDQNKDDAYKEPREERSCGRSQTLLYNPKRRHSTIGYMSPMEFERQVGLA